MALVPQKRRMPLCDPDDPLSVVDIQSSPTNLDEMMMGDSQADGGVGVITLPGGIRLTEKGVRTVLNRVRRPKPLLKLTCATCKRTTHDPDTYVPGDYLDRLVRPQVIVVASCESPLIIYYI